jgi:hypothetical protein
VNRVHRLGFDAIAELRDGAIQLFAGTTSDGVIGAFAISKSVGHRSSFQKLSIQHSSATRGLRQGIASRLAGGP